MSREESNKDAKAEISKKEEREPCMCEYDQMSPYDTAI